MNRADPALERAKQHVKDVQDFLYHLMAYVLVNLIVIVIDRQTAPNDGFLGLDWAYWLIIAWGFGIAGHAIATFFGEYRAHRIYDRDKERNSP